MMSAAAALAQAPATTPSSAIAAMDIDERDSPSSSAFAPGGERDLAERLANAHLGEEEIKGNRLTNPSSVEGESTMEEEDDLPTPKGFFVDSPTATDRGNVNSNDASQAHNAAEHCLPNRPLQMPSSGLLPPWPAVTTPQRSGSSQQSVDDHHRPHRTPPGPRQIAPHSCPRPSSSSPPSSVPRPLHASLSSGRLDLWEQTASRDSGMSREEDGECPASRAVEAMHALRAANASIVLAERNQEEGGGVWAAPEETSRQPTGSLSPRVPQRTFPAYPSTANEPLPNAHDDDPRRDDLYTFSPHTPSGRILTALSRLCVSPRRRHVHGGSALAGFLALLLVTCANYMLGPMRDAAALAVGVSHIPALTLASTALALGSSVPVGWLFEAPDPRRRRVWKRMGLTRGETQGTSLALFYRVFAFLLLSYALGFQMVDRFGNGKGRGGNNRGAEGETQAAAGGESVVALVGTFFLRCLDGVGIPVIKMLASLEQRSSSSAILSRMNWFLSSSMSTLQLYAHKSIPSLFLHACGCIVNKSGKVIYVMFFLVVHLMKLHSLSLIWGVTTEAMEYEETAEQRMTGLAKEKKDKERGGLAASGAGKSSEKDEHFDEGSSKNSSLIRGESPKKDSKPSRSSLRLKRLGFVGFGGTLGGILGSVIASFAAHTLNLSGLLILAAILLELSANLSIELGRIMQRHWEEQMRSLSYGDLASLSSSAESLAANGQQQQQTMATTVDSSMRKSVSLGSMKRVASGSFSSGNLMKLAAASQQPQGGDGNGESMTRARSIGSISPSNEDNSRSGGREDQHQQPNMIDDNSFKQRLLRGFTTILRSRLLMAIFAYNALYASTSVLLSFQRAELVANRSSSGEVSSSGLAVSNTAFLAKINTASSVAVFALQASGLGAYIANGCGQRGALALMPCIRLCGVLLLGYWHLMSNGQPPNLIAFLVIDEFTKVINFAIAKPVRENLWRGLSAEARYEAKPIVDTLANRWGAGSAAFLVSFISRITDLTGFGVVNENGERSVFGFPPVLLLCIIISAWWTTVSVDVGNIRQKIDLELKKQQ